MPQKGGREKWAMEPIKSEIIKSMKDWIAERRWHDTAQLSSSESNAQQALDTIISIPQIVCAPRIRGESRCQKALGLPPGGKQSATAERGAHCAHFKRQHRWAGSKPAVPELDLTGPPRKGLFVLLFVFHHSPQAGICSSFWRTV